MRALKDWAQADRDAFERLHDRRGCTCFISPPCSCCTHPGHPLNQECDGDAWEEVFDLDEACEKAMERIKQQIDRSVLDHLDRSARLSEELWKAIYIRHLRLVKLEVIAYMVWREHQEMQRRRWLNSHGVVL